MAYFEGEVMARRLKILSSRRLKILLVFLVVIVIAAGFWYLWRVRVGEVQLSAKTELCQNKGQLGAMFGGSQWMVGANLIPVDFKGHEVQFHKLAAPWLKKVSDEIKEKKVGYSFHEVQTFNWRAKTTGHGQSLHSYGIAVDVNPGQNPYNFSGQLITDLPRKAINIFKKYGFYWGGDWNGFVDPMHFEWYGAKITGRLFNKNTKDSVGASTVYVDGDPLTRIKGNFSFAIPEGRHLVTIKNSRYKDYKFKIKVSCNQVVEKDIALKPIPLGVPGTIRGKIIMPPDVPLELPGDIYIDGVYSAKTDVGGNFIVRDVTGGVTHTVEARVIPLFIGSTKVNVRPGKTIKDVNIEMVAGLNR